MRLRSIILTYFIAILIPDLMAQTDSLFKDPRDGKTYRTVEIGGQTWMAENLKFWVEKESPYYVGISTYYGLETDNLRRYGRLYPYEVALKACPEGWHLPTINEWIQMINSFGEVYNSEGEIPKSKDVSKEEAKEIKKRYKEIFALLQEGGTSGFDVLYGGIYDPSSPMGVPTFSGLEKEAIFWSSDDNEGKGAFNMKAEAFRFYKGLEGFAASPVKKSTRSSVRCVKDQSAP